MHVQRDLSLSITTSVTIPAQSLDSLFANFLTGHQTFVRNWTLMFLFSTFLLHLWEHIVTKGMLMMLESYTTLDQAKSLWHPKPKVYMYMCLYLYIYYTYIHMFTSTLTRTMSSFNLCEWIGLYCCANVTRQVFHSPKLSSWSRETERDGR